MTSPVPTITLNNGVEMPLLGFGVFQVPPPDTEKVVLDAFAAGYRSIDTAAAYMNEEGVGKAIATSGIPRDELFITTKLWIGNAGEVSARDAFERSAEKLGVDTVDLYLIHQPFGDIHGSWRALEQLHNEGRIRAIGVSNFHLDRLVDLMEVNTVVPAVNQIETHPFYQRAAEQEYMQKLGVVTESWGPFAEGKNDLFSNPVLAEIGASYDRSVAQVVLRWLIQRGVVVIPKSVRRERMEENIDVFSFTLSDADMSRIAELDGGKSLFIDHRDPEDVRMLHGFSRELVALF